MEAVYGLRPGRAGLGWRGRYTQWQVITDGLVAAGKDVRCADAPTRNRSADRIPLPRRSVRLLQYVCPPENNYDGLHYVTGQL